MQRHRWTRACAARVVAQVRQHLLASTAANTPSNPSWWVIQGPLLLCFRSAEEWGAQAQPRLVVDLQRYTALKTYDSSRRLTIALLPTSVLSDHAPRESPPALLHVPVHVCSLRRPARDDGILRVLTATP
jgi:hypothetical protein